MSETGGLQPSGGDAASATLKATRALMWLLVVPVLLLLAVLTVLQYRQRIDGVERELLRRGVERAQELEVIAQPAIAHVADLHELLRANWEQPPDAGRAMRQGLTPHTGADGRRDGYSLDGLPAPERARLGQLWWQRDDDAAPSELWLRRAALFNEAARVVHRRDPGFAATWFAVADENASFGYPWISTATMLEAYGAAGQRAIAPVWQAGVAKANANLQRAPDVLSFWGAPYVSQLDRRLVVSHVKMLVVGGRYVGEVSVDFRLEPLQRKLLAWRDEQTPGRVWIVDDAGRVLADSAQPLAAPSGAALADTRVQVALADRVAAGLRDAAAPATSAGERLLQGSDSLLVSARRAGSPWAYVQELPRSALRAQVWPTLRPNALLGLVLVVVFVAGQALLARRLDAIFRAQRELQQRERRTEVFKSAIVDNAVTAIVTTDVEGRIVEFNATAEQMFRCRREEMIGRVLGDALIPERHRERHQEQMRRLRSGETIGGVGQPTEMRGLRADGSEFPLEMLVVRIDFDGQVFYTGFMSDITERRTAAREIERQREALRQSEKLGAMGSLLAGVAHELNNPLAIVVGRASLLEEKTAGTPAADDARRIREAADRCGRIVRTFLAMARQKPAVRSAVQLNHLARAAADMLGYTLRSHGIELDLQLDEALPAVQADADQIGQIVLNLIVNAQQSLSSLDGPRRIGLQSGVWPAGPDPGPGARAWLRVSDNGRGIAPGTREQIFEPYFTTKPEAIGTGLGLAVSRSLARDHGGDLIAEEVASGASFLLTLPLAESGTAPRND